MRKKSAEILDSWREKAAEEWQLEELELYPRRALVTGLPDNEVTVDSLANPNRVILLEG